MDADEDWHELATMFPGKQAFVYGALDGGAGRERHGRGTDPPRGKPIFRGAQPPRMMRRSTSYVRAKSTVRAVAARSL
jgi:hypothetical protein